MKSPSPSPQRPGYFAACCLLLIAAAPLAGCSGFAKSFTFWQEEKPAKDTKPVAGPTEVKTGGDGFNLGDVEQPALSPQQLAQQVGAMLRSNHRAAAWRMVWLYPDVALAVLRDPVAADVSPEILAMIAQAHDRQCTRAAEGANWTALAQDRLRDLKRYAAFDEKRRQFITQFQNGHSQEALQLGLAAPPGAPGNLLAIDCENLTGIALVLANRPREAVAAFQNAASAARNVEPYQAANLLLLLSDAQRRAGDAAAAAATWCEAAQLAADLAAGAIPLSDPILWERAAYLRPVNTAWPPAAQQRMADCNGRFGIALAAPPAAFSADQITALAEASLWINIGHWRLARNESQAALVALKRAESMSSNQATAGQLRLVEAKALVRLGQAPAATAMLIALADDPNRRVSHPAMALLGTLKLQQGCTQQGFNLLRRAVEEDAACLWPEHAQAEADLGLAYLLMGDDAAGLRGLHDAQQNFESGGAREQLMQCLENEAAYLEKAKKDDLAKAVRKRLDLLQAG